MDALVAAFGSPEGMEVDAQLRKDEAKFIDFAGLCIFLTEKHTVVRE